MSIQALMMILGISFILMGYCTPYPPHQLEYNEFGVELKQGKDIKIHFSWAEIIEEAKRRGRL